MACENFLGYSNDFLDQIPNVWSIEEIVYKLNFIKSENINLWAGERLRW